MKPTHTGTSWLAALQTMCLTLVTCTATAALNPVLLDPAAIPSHDRWVATRTQSFVANSMNWTQQTECKQRPQLSWWRDYTHFHQQQLADPDNAQFLLYLCGHPSWEGAPHNASQILSISPCSGMGDRLRGMMEMTRLAAYSRRVLLFHWSHPLQLERMFKPGDIDWRVKPEYGLDISSAPVIKWMYKADQPPGLQDGSWRERHASDRLVVMLLMQHDSSGKHYPYMPSVGALMSPERACLFRSFFSDYTDEVLHLAAEQRTRLGLPEQYTAIHLRLGGMQGEPTIGARFDNFKGLLSSLVCSRSLAAANNHSAVLLITDNELLRRLVAAGKFQGIVGPAPDYLPVHMDKARTASQEAHLASIVDLALLSQAKCFLWSVSGFSFTAWHMGYHSCHNSVNSCLEAMEKKKSKKQRSLLQLYEQVMY